MSNQTSKLATSQTISKQLDQQLDQPLNSSKLATKLATKLAARLVVSSMHSLTYRTLINSQQSIVNSQQSIVNSHTYRSSFCSTNRPLEPTLTLALLWRYLSYSNALAYYVKVQIKSQKWFIKFGTDCKPGSHLLLINKMDNSKVSTL